MLVHQRVTCSFSGASNTGIREHSRALEAKVEELGGQLERCRGSMQQLEKSEAMIWLGFWIP